MTRILIVEDDQDVANLATRWLEEKGYGVQHVTDGPSAVEFLKQGCFMVADTVNFNWRTAPFRSYDSMADFQTITRGARGRRIEPTDPGSSLLLLKPTMTVPHKGGLRFAVDSPAYEILSQWIAEGALAHRSATPWVWPTRITS